MKYKIIFKDDKKKIKKAVIIIAKNIIELYHKLEKSEITNIIEIKEV